MYVFFKCSEPSAGFILMPFSDQLSKQNLEDTGRLLFVLLFPQTGYEPTDFMDWLLVDYLLHVRHLEQKQHFQLSIFLNIHILSNVPIWMFWHPTEY